MKRVGNLFDLVLTRENLLEAYRRASRGKGLRPDRITFAADLETNLSLLRTGLDDGSYPVGHYRVFTIHDPKERKICAASFSERVLQHALMNICEPYFDRWMIFDTYASRKGKGQLRAVRRAQQFARHHRWFLKCDFRKYFDSIPHEGIRAMLVRKFKDYRLLGWFDRILETYETVPGRGLPIGNLTSQHFANLYLDPLDRKYSPYVRYMDDFVFWSDDKDELKRIRDEVVDFSGKSLGLAVKECPFINRTQAGMDFLGMRVFPDRVDLNRVSCLRYLHSMKRLMATEVDEGRLQQRLTSLTAFAAQADSVNWRKEKLERLFRVCGEQPMGRIA